jgi:hypothetical protein
MKHTATVALVLLLSVPLSLAATPRSAPQPDALKPLSAPAFTCSQITSAAVPALSVLPPSDSSAQLPTHQLGPMGYCCEPNNGVFCRFMSAVTCSDDGGTPYSTLATCQKHCF